jgi:hypothetical protein
MALAISTLKNIFPLHTKMQYYHLSYPNVQKCHIIVFPLSFFRVKNLAILHYGEHHDINLYSSIVQYPFELLLC